MDIVGVMSGTSLDGLDLALCHFYPEHGCTQFKLVAAETISYEATWKERLQNAYHASAEQYLALNHRYGKFIADQINRFLGVQRQANGIASHGHTVFHQPEKGFSAQLGCGATIAAQTGLPVVCDFRSLDVALGGQGAPLVPIGDRDLFGHQSACLNIGGIANISFTQHHTTKAFDICLANMALNYLSELAGKPYDEGGIMASKGHIHSGLLQQLLNLNTFHNALGREWFEQQFLPEINALPITVEDKLATCVEYTAIRISYCLAQHQLASVLVSGGGAYNGFLIERLQHHYKGHLHFPDDEVIQFKEAIIFAYLGYLRFQQQTNTLRSVTGAIEDSIGGALYMGKHR